MVLHLEAGSCSSGTTAKDIDNYASKCYQSSHYTSHDQEYEHRCPDCETLFKWVSGVLQHAEGGACEVSLSKGTPLGKFLHFLRQTI